MSRVVVRPVYPAGDKHFERRFKRGKTSYLPGRSVRAKHIVVGDIKRVLLVARGMFERSIKRGKIVKIVFDFLRFENRKTHTREYGHEFVFNQRYGVKRAFFALFCGKSDVDFFVGVAFFAFEFFDFFGFFFKDLVCPVFKTVYKLTETGAFVLFGFAEFSHKRGDFARLAEYVFRFEFE